MRADQYNHLAEAYEESTAKSAYNTMCERPTTLSLIGDVRGKAVLDAACGTGFYAAYCEKHRARSVFAFDGSPNMVELARTKLSYTTIFVHELGSQLTSIPEETLDGVICALALEYTEDLIESLQEFYRLLKPDGFLVFSIENPWLVFQRYGETYWDEELVEHTSTFLNGVKGYRRPLSMYLNGLRESGFRFEQMIEAKPVEQCKDRFPEIYRRMMEIPFFISIRGRKAA